MEAPLYSAFAVFATGGPLLPSDASRCPCESERSRSRDAPLHSALTVFGMEEPRPLPSEASRRPDGNEGGRSRDARLAFETTLRTCCGGVWPPGNTWDTSASLGGAAGLRLALLLREVELAGPRLGAEAAERRGLVRSSSSEAEVLRLVEGTSPRLRTPRPLDLLAFLVR